MTLVLDNFLADVPKFFQDKSVPKKEQKYMFLKQGSQIQNRSHGYFQSDRGVF